MQQEITKKGTGRYFDGIQMYNDYCNLTRSIHKIQHTDCTVITLNSVAHMFHVKIHQSCQPITGNYRKHFLIEMDIDIFE